MSHLPAARAALAPPPLVDTYGRCLRYLRLSVTDRCNLSCHYCNPVKGCLGHEADTLSWDDLSFLVDCCVEDLGMEALRITGGEPTIRPGLTDWIRSLRGHAGLRDISMTTNGVLLSRMAQDLANAGLDRVNVSLDTWDPERFAQITRGGSLPRVLEGLHAAIRTFSRVKINCVSLKGVTIPELEEYIRFSHEHGVEVRFIELMPIFDQKEYFQAHFLPTGELMRAVEDLGYRLVEDADEGPASRNRTGYGPATTWSVEGTRARLGFISQMSDTKCLTCNKLRLTSDGALKPCLLMPEEVDLLSPIKSRNRPAILQAMTKAFLERADRYDAQTALEKPVGRPMQATGG